MEWFDDFSIGNELIDSEHQRIFDMVRQIRADLEERDEKKLRATSLAALSNVYDHVHNHFMHEEEVMESLRMPADLIERHKEDHNKWRSHLSHITEQANEMILATESYSIQEIIEILLEANLDFLREHFETFDMEIKKYVLNS